MKLFASTCMVLLFALPWAAQSCSPAGDWQATSSEDQWSAAAYVVFGTADGHYMCGDSTDVEVFNLSASLCPGPDMPSDLVLVRNLSFTKGNVSGCSEIVVGGFTSSASCGVGAPALGSTGTYFLCTAILDSGVCMGTLNTQGNIHLGFRLEEVVPPTSPACPQDNTCRDVTTCATVGTSSSPWHRGVLGLVPGLLWHML